jgi:hypothetical protein
MRFRPPAVPLLNALPQGAELSLIPEPSNPYDEKAIQVWMRFSSIPASQHEDLAMHSAGFGFDLDELRSREDWMLGYVAKTENRLLHDELLAGRGYTATLGFNTEGKPKVEIELTEATPA